MSVVMPEVRVGEAARHERLSVFPLFAAEAVGVEYLLSDEAIGSGNLAVREVSESGSVPELLVENQGEVRVLFLEGEELVGAKQNRVLNTSVLIAPKTTTRIPVSCVERGRWGYRSRQFGSSGRCSPSKLRHILKASVSRSLRASGSHRSDQGEVWREVDRQQASLGTPSGTSAMSDTFEAYESRLAEFRQRLAPVEGAIGFAVAIGDRVLAVDLFDKPSTCRKVWQRVLTGYVLDALECEPGHGSAAACDVERLLQAARAMPWQRVEAVGEGEEYRAESGHEVHASTLALGGAVVHLSVVLAG